MSETKWYENQSVIDICVAVKNELNSTKDSFVCLGYWLKQVRDRRLYEETGHKNLYEFALDQFGLSRSSVSRFMAINDKFAVDGNSPILLPKYDAFSQSQMQEMLTLTDEQIESVTPDTTVKEIRELKPKKAKKDVDAENEALPNTIKEIKPKTDVRVYTECDSYKMRHECKGCYYDDAGNCPFDRTGMQTVEEQLPGQMELSDYRAIANVVSAHSDYLTFIAEAIIEELGITLDGIHSESDLEDEIMLQDFTFAIDNEEYFIKFHHQGENIEITTFENGPTDMKTTYKELWDEICRCIRTAEKWDEENNEVCDVAQDDESVEEYDTYTEDMEEAAEAAEIQNARLYEDNPEYFNSLDVQKYLSDAKIKLESLRKSNNFQKAQRHAAIDVAAYSLLMDKSRETDDETKRNINTAVRYYNLEDYSSAEFYLYHARKSLVEKYGVEDASPKYDRVFTQPEQPELPQLKNNDQRGQFIDNYMTWPVWIDIQETGERYYRYNIDNEIAFVIKVSLRHPWGNGKYSKDTEYGSEQYYLLGIEEKYTSSGAEMKKNDSKTFHECNTNKSSLIEFLKKWQKGDVK